MTSLNQYASVFFKKNCVDFCRFSDIIKARRVKEEEHMRRTIFMDIQHKDIQHKDIQH